MKYLLDTSVLIHSLISKPKLNQRALGLLSGKTSGLNRAIGLMAIQPLHITHRHALELEELPLVHRDPFDRMLIAQARTERMVLLTADRIFQSYEVEQEYCGL